MDGDAVKPFNAKLKTLVSAATKLQLLHDDLRSAGFGELADQAFDLAKLLSKQLGQHVVSHGVQPIEVQS